MPRSAALLLRDRAGVRSRDLVIELACGKGATAVAIARATGCRVVGVDAFEPFVLEARERARRAGLGTRCTFVCAEVKAWAGARRRGTGASAKAALMLGLFPLRRSIPLLASLVAPGGWCLADDAVYLKDDPTSADLTLARAGAIVERAGLELRESRVLTPGEVRRLGERTVGILQRSAAALAREHRVHRAALQNVVKDHREAAILLQGDLRPSLWLCQRAKG